MQLTKFTHACVRLDDGDRSLVIDPGAFSEIEDAVDGVSAVLITHEHFDHIEVDRLGAALQKDSRLRVYGPASVVDLFGKQHDQIVAIDPGQEFEAGGFAVRTFGRQHAVIHPAVPVIPNLGYLIEGVYHPGDSFFVPPAEVETLLLPINAPWSKVSEVIDFAIAVGAARAHQIHDNLIKDLYAGLVQDMLGQIAAPHGVEYQPLKVKESVSV